MDNTNHITQEKINPKKIGWILRNNWHWLLLIFVITNLAAYLMIRWTKPVYEANSEIKMDIQSDAQEFGIGGLMEDKNLSILSGEIELLKSKLFFQKLIDSLDLGISYFTKGNFLDDEKYPNPPFIVDYNLTTNYWVDRPVTVKFSSEGEYSLQVEGDSISSQIFKVGQLVDLGHISFRLKNAPTAISLTDEDFQFVINSNESLQNYLDASLNVAPLNINANTIKISFQDHNKNKAKDLVNAINTIYIKYTQEEKSLANKNKIQWIDTQLEKIESDLDSYENYIEEFTIENRTNDLDVDLKNTISGINQIDSQQFEITRRLGWVNQLETNLVENIILPPSRILPTEINQAINRYNDLVIEREQLGLSYSESTFTIKEKDKEIEAIHSSVSNQLSNYKQQLTSNLTDLGRKRQNLERSFTSIPGKNTDFNKNQRFYKLYEEFYLTLMQNKAEFEIAVAGLTPNFKILSPATISNNPVYPNKVLIFGAGLISSFSLCLLFLGIKYIVEDKINSLEEMESIVSFPVAGSIPKARGKSGESRLIVNKYPKSGVSESLRSIRTNIQFLMPDKDQSVISVTSSVGGEGKTFLAANLAAITAASRKKVCLVDLDMRKPKVHLTFQGNDAPHPEVGISTVLIHKHKLDEAIITSSIENLDYITSGPIPPNPSELILNGEFKALLEELKSKYDLIILDTPPMGLVTDGILAMKCSDLTLMVIRAGYTRKRDLISSKRHFQLSESKISVVLNGLTESNGYGYSYGYGYYSERN